MTTWNVFGVGEILLVCLAMIGFLAVVGVIATAGKKVDDREVVLKAAARLQNLEPEERVLDDIQFGGTDPD